MTILGRTVIQTDRVRLSTCINLSPLHVTNYHLVTSHHPRAPLRHWFHVYHALLREQRSMSIHDGAITEPTATEGGRVV
jgi:hypothetical protein